MTKKTQTRNTWYHRLLCKILGHIWYYSGSRDRMCARCTRFEYSGNFKSDLRDYVNLQVIYMTDKEIEKILPKPEKIEEQEVKTNFK